MAIIFRADNLANFFFVSDGRLMTLLARNFLGGVTRATVYDLAAELGIDVREGNCSIHDVYSADEAFASGTSASIMPVRSLSGVVIDSAVAALPDRRHCACFTPSPTWPGRFCRPGPEPSGRQ